MEPNDAIIYVLAAWSTVIGAVIAVVAPTYLWARRIWRRSIREVLDQALAQVDDIHQQTTKNGGTSKTLADSVLRIERHLGIVDGTGNVLDTGKG